jgi:dipeptidyl-peptidase III
LGNINNNKIVDDIVPFVRHHEVEFLRKYRAKSFEIMIACHELLGHGSGRLLMEKSPDEFNFNRQDPPVDPLTGEPVQSWYKQGQTWHSIFGNDASSYEECRADGVALFLVCHKPILKIFGYTEDTAIRADDSQS